MELFTYTNEDGDECPAAKGDRFVSEFGDIAVQCEGRFGWSAWVNAGFGSGREGWVKLGHSFRTVAGARDAAHAEAEKL
jgi:hypothetical protein